MARRKSRKSNRSSRKKSPFNVTKAAEAYLQTNILTQNFMGTNPLTALTGIEYGQTGITAGSAPGQRPSATYGYGYMPSKVDTVTVPEMLGIGTATAGQGLDVVKRNVMNSENVLRFATHTIGLRVGFTVLNRMLRKEKSYLNKGLQALGLRKDVMF